MKFDLHLFLSEISLPPSSEWTDSSEGWRVVRVGKGAAYWLAEGTAREVGEGEIVALAPSSKGCLRASQLGEVKLHYFHFCPELLSGFLTLSERHYFQSITGRADCAVRLLPPSHPTAQEFAGLVTQAPTGNNFLCRCQLMHLVASIFAEEMARYQPPATKSAAATLVRFSVFTDYGQRYLLEPSQGRSGSLEMWGPALASTPPAASTSTCD